jgi:hypothetical protein
MTTILRRLGKTSSVAIAVADRMRRGAVKLSRKTLSRPNGEPLVQGTRRRFSGSRKTVGESTPKSFPGNGLIRITVPPPPPVGNGP